MKKKNVFRTVYGYFYCSSGNGPVSQLTEEAKQAYQKMMSEERRRSDEAWQKHCLLYRKKREKVVRIFRGLPVHTICRRHEFLLSPVLKEEVCTVSAVVAVR